MRIFVILAFLICGITYSSSLCAGTPPESPSKIINYFDSSVSATSPYLPGMTIKQVENLLGRHLKLKEKIAWKLYKIQLKNKKTGDENIHTKKGKAAFILGICGIAGLFVPIIGVLALPAAILAIIFGKQARKENPNDQQAKTGLTLGWIGLGVFLLAVVLILALVAALSIH